MAKNLRCRATVVDRIWIRGTTGSGKTTLAQAVAAKLDIPAIDLDELNWMPGWVERPKDEFIDLVAEAVKGSRWSLAGNYGKVVSVIGPRADVIVWLDYPFLCVFGRLLRRTIRRVILGDPCCNGNRERLLISFFSRDSVLLWCITTHRRRHRDCLAFMVETPPPGQIRLRHSSPEETRLWLKAIS